MRIDRFKDLRKENDEKIELNNKSLGVYTNIRLVTIIALIVCVVVAMQQPNSRIVMIVISCVLLVISIVLSFFMGHYKKIINHLNYKNNVIRDYIQRIDNKVNSKDTGLEFSKKEYFEQDLDILGRNSIYNYINFSKTPYGKAETARLLSADLSLENGLNDRQDASQELSDKLNDTLDIVSRSYEYNHLNENSKVSDLEDSLKALENVYKPTAFKLLFAILYLAAFITIIVLSCIKLIPPYSIIIVFVAGYFISNLIYPETKILAQDLAHARTIISGYSELIDVISNKNFDNKLLNELQKPIKLLNAKALRSFNVISGFAESRNNILYQVLFDGSIMVDAYVLLFYYRWQKKYKEYLRHAFECIGQIEGLISISTINLVKENSTVPSISNKFDFDDIMHPLIKEDVCIGNSFKFNGRNIITGSNMSGKTTFMRAIGTNYVLFMAGSNVCAKNFSAPILKLFTSMKVVDDVNNNISTFYGEILRVKKIVEYLPEEKPMLVLIDEIFKGTNTHDRIIGAKSVIDKLNRNDIYSIITTHDPELCAVEGVRNYHFLEHYEDDKILFDYKIHDGISNTRNAIYLLKLAGIVNE